MTLVRRIAEPRYLPLAVKAISILLIVSHIKSILGSIRTAFIGPGQVLQLPFRISRGITSLCWILAMYLLFRMVTEWETHRLVEKRKAVIFLVLLAVGPLINATYAFARPFFWGPSLQDILINSPFTIVLYVSIVAGTFFLLYTACLLRQLQTNHLALPEMASAGGKHFAFGLLCLGLMMVSGSALNLMFLLGYEYEYPDEVWYLSSLVLYAIAGLAILLASTGLLRTPLSYSTRQFLERVSLFCLLWGGSVFLKFVWNLALAMDSGQPPLSPLLLLLRIVGYLSMAGLSFLYILMGIHLWKISRYATVPPRLG